MPKYALSHKAVADLAEIWDYTYETWSAWQAEKYYYLLLDACQALADGSLSGKTYLAIGTDILGCQVGQHIIFYRKVKKGDIEVARILHGRMDLKDRLGE